MPFHLCFCICIKIGLKSIKSCSTRWIRPRTYQDIIRNEFSDVFQDTCVHYQPLWRAGWGWGLYLLMTDQLPNYLSPHFKLHSIKQQQSVIQWIMRQITIKASNAKSSFILLKRYHHVRHIQTNVKCHTESKFLSYEDWHFQQTSVTDKHQIISKIKI